MKMITTAMKKRMATWLLALTCAAWGAAAWATNPVTLWDGNFVQDGQQISRGGKVFTLHLNGNSIQTENGASYLQIDNSAHTTYGVTVDISPAPTTGPGGTLVIKYSDTSYNTDAYGTLMSLVCNKGLDKGNSYSNIVALTVADSSGTVNEQWGEGYRSNYASTGSSATTKTIPLNSNTNYLALSYNSSGVYGYSRVNGVWSMIHQVTDSKGDGTYNFCAFSVGGQHTQPFARTTDYASNCHPISGMKIYAIAYVETATTATTGISSYAFPEDRTAYVGSFTQGVTGFSDSNITWTKDGAAISDISTETLTAAEVVLDASSATADVTFTAETTSVGVLALKGPSDGTHALTLSAASTTITATDGYIVKSGLVKLPNWNSYGQSGNRVMVESGASLDGKGAYGSKSDFKTLVLQGGTYTDSGTNQGNGQTRPFSAISLDINSSIAGSGQMGLVNSSWGATSLELCGNTLTCGSSSTFYAENVTSTTPGKLLINSGTWSMNKTKFSAPLVDLESGANGAINAAVAVTVQNYTQAGTHSGSGVVTVSGKYSLEPGANARSCDPYNWVVNAMDVKVTQSKKYAIVGSQTSRDIFTSATRPTLTVTSSTVGDAYAMILDSGLNNNAMYVKNLRGNAYIRADYNASDITADRTINTLQTEDTEYSGVFMDNSGRNAALAVVGDGTGKKLTLTGNNTTQGALYVTNSAYVVLSGNGAWSNGPVHVDATSTLEIAKDTASTSLKLDNAGQVIVTSGTLNIATSSYSNTGNGTVSVKDGATLKIVVSEDDIVNGYKASGVTLETGATFKFVDANGAEITENVDGTTLKAAVNHWSDTEDSTFENTKNWSSGSVPEANSDVCFNISEDTTVSVASAITLGKVYVKGTGTLSFSGAQITATSVKVMSGATNVVDTGHFVVNATSGTAAEVEENACLKFVPGKTGSNYNALTVSYVITGAGSVAIGEGNVTLSAANTMTGGITVEENGKLTASNESYPLGAQGAVITVNEGGAVDLNGKGMSYTYRIAGTGRDNSGAIFSSGNVSSGAQQMNKLVLIGDATINTDHTWGLIASQYETANLTLNGHTLTKKGSNSFWFCNVQDTDGDTGTIDVEEGEFYVHGSQKAASDDMLYDLTIGANGTVNCQGSFVVKSLTMTGGTLKSASNRFLYSASKSQIFGSVNLSGFTGSYGNYGTLTGYSVQEMDVKSVTGGDAGAADFTAGTFKFSKLNVYGGSTVTLDSGDTMTELWHGYGATVHLTSAMTIASITGESSAGLTIQPATTACKLTPSGNFQGAITLDCSQITTVSSAAVLISKSGLTDSGVTIKNVPATGVASVDSTQGVLLSPAVASYDGTGYASLDDAITAANGQTGTLKIYQAGSADISGKTIRLNSASAAALTVTGSGTIICDGFAPTSSQLVLGDSWTGTVEIANYTQTSGYFDPTLYGNTASTVRLNGVSAIPLLLGTSTTWPAAHCALKALEIGDGGFATCGSFSSGSYVGVITANLTGTGTITAGTTYGCCTYVFKGDHSAFAGSISVPSNKSAICLVGTNDDTPSLQSAGTLFIGASVAATIATGKTWTAAGGIKIGANASLTVQTAEKATATSGTISAATSGYEITTSEDTTAGTTTYACTEIVNEAKIGDTEYATLQDAIDNLVGTQTLDDITILREGLTAPDGYAIVNNKLTFAPLETILPGTLSWLPVGDSITEGEANMGHPEVGDTSTRAGYRFQLWTNLVARGQAVKSVGFRSGHSGTVEADTCDWAWHGAMYGGVISPLTCAGNKYGAQLFNVESFLEVSGYPDIISIMIGINDLSFCKNADTTFAAWTALVDKYATLRPNSKIVVSTVLPVGSGNSLAYFAPFNALVRAAHEAGTAPFNHANVIFADVAKVAFNDTYTSAYFKDGVHPNEIGSRKVARAFLSEGFIPALQAIAAEKLAIAQVHNGTSGQLTVRLNKATNLTEAASLTLTGTTVTGAVVSETLTGGTLGADLKTIAFTTSAALSNGTYTATLTLGSGDTAVTLASDDNTHFDIVGSGAAENVKSTYLEGFKKFQTVTPAATSQTIVTNDETLANGSIDRVGYYMELKRAGEPAQFVWVSMDARPFGWSPAKVGVPTAASGTIKAIVDDVTVFGNRGNFSTNVVDGRAVIEFTPYQYTAADQTGDNCVADASPNGSYGWNDTLGSSTTLYGCMQVARITGDERSVTTPAAEMLFAYNTFNSTANSDIGIGSLSTHRNNAGTQIDAVYDWTWITDTAQLTKFMMSAYEVKKIEIWVEHVDKDDADAKVTINGNAAYYRHLTDAIAAAEGAPITLLRNATNAPAAGLSYPAANINVGGNTLTLTLTTCDVEQDMVITNLTGAGAVVINSTATSGQLGGVRLSGSGADYTGTITVEKGGTLIADCGNPWGTGSVIVKGTLAVAHGAYQNNISLANVTFEAGSTYYVVDSAYADGYITVNATFATGSSNAVPALVEADYDPVSVEVTYTRENAVDCFSYTPEVSGDACLLDYTFTNTVAESGNIYVKQSAHSQLKDDYYKLVIDDSAHSQKAQYLDWDTNLNQFAALKLCNRPWRGRTNDDYTGGSKGTALQIVPNDRAMTVATIGIFPATNHTCFVSYGSVYHNLFLATGETSDEVELIRVKSDAWDFKTSSCTVLTSMRVPHGATARHAVVFATEDHKTFNIYLDGTLWSSYTFEDAVEFGNGIQLGGWFGGSNNTEGYYHQANATTAANASVSAIRIYEGMLGPNAIAQLSKEFPYVSPAIPYDRKLELAGENGSTVTDTAWMQDARWVNHTNENAWTATPDSMSQLVITNGTTSARTIAINCTQKIESLDLDGEAPIVFTSTGANEIECYGKVCIHTDVTNAWNAIDMFGVPLDVESGKKLVWDLTTKPLEDFGDVATNRLTGVSTQPTGTDKSAWPLILEYPRSEVYSFDTWYNTTDHCYYLIILPPAPVTDASGTSVGYLNVTNTAQLVITDVTGKNINIGNAAYDNVTQVIIKPCGYDITTVFTNSTSGVAITGEGASKSIAAIFLNGEATWGSDNRKVKPTPSAMTGTADTVSIDIGTPIPGLYYEILTSTDGTNFSAPSGSEATQATSTDAHTVSVTPPKGSKVTYYKLSVKAAK